MREAKAAREANPVYRGGRMAKGLSEILACSYVNKSKHVCFTLNYVLVRFLLLLRRRLFFLEFRQTALTSVDFVRKSRHLLVQPLQLQLFGDL